MWHGFMFLLITSGMAFFIRWYWRLTATTPETALSRCPLKFVNSLSTCPESHQEHQEAQRGCHQRSPECDDDDDDVMASGMLRALITMEADNHQHPHSHTFTLLNRAAGSLRPQHFKTGVSRLKWRVQSPASVREAGRRSRPLIGSGGGGQRLSLAQVSGK